MQYIEMKKAKKIALVAHDNMKSEMIEWAVKNAPVLAKHSLCATGTTGKLLEDALGWNVEKFKSGPLGGDLQIGSRITEGDIDMLIFFWDPLESQPHDPDVKALLRIATVWNIPIATTKSTADFMIVSPLMKEEYKREVHDFTKHNNRMKV